MNIKNILSRSFATIESDCTTGKKVDTQYVTGYDYLAEFEIEKINLKISNELKNIIIMLDHGCDKEDIKNKIKDLCSE